jgi:hypothetical protein
MKKGMRQVYCHRHQGFFNTAMEVPNSCSWCGSPDYDTPARSRPPRKIKAGNAVQLPGQKPSGLG